jgi:hypothetical protein
MRRLNIALVMLAVNAAGQQPPAALPSWLVPYSGAKAESPTALATRIEVAYATDAKPGLVLAHYQHLLEGAGLPFLPSFDGVGTSIRAAAAECDLLIKIREQGAGTLANVSCAAKSTSGTSSPSEVKLITSNSTSPANNRSRLMEERIREGEEHTRRVLAEAEARHKRGIRDMEIYDQPVNGRSRKKDASPRPEN